MEISLAQMGTKTKELFGRLAELNKRNWLVSLDLD